MIEDGELIAGIIITIVLIFVLGFCIGDITDEYIKSDYLARALYKNTEEYVQHKRDNFYNLLKLVEIKEQGCIKKK